jgi:signal transduction histidine kinase
VIGAMVATTLMLAGVGAIFVRLVIRHSRLREEAKQKDLERRLQNSERLGALGLLTTGVAHEINNPLEGIGNYLALLQKECSTNETRQRYLEQIQYGFQRIQNIVRDLCSFARPAVNEGTADLSAVISRVLKLVAYAKEFRGIEVELKGLDRELLAAGDSSRLEQVFLNLFLNAASAMQGHGRLTVEAQCPAEKIQGAPMVRITVEDSGPGIPAEHLDKIFDPFFSTKEGTGLGLSISYGIIRAHHGSIQVDNRPGSGARFTILLPALSRRKPIKVEAE